MTQHSRSADKDNSTATDAAPLTEKRQRSLTRLRRWVHVLDDAVRIPVIGVRVGLDALIGLIPVAGDLAGAAASCLLIAEALRLRAPRRVWLRMAVNVVVDVVIGVVPVLGDILDIAWRANRRNLRLLEDWLAEETQQDTGSPWPARLFRLAALVSLGLAGLCLYWLLR